MADSGSTRPLTGWQRANVLAAAQYIRELLLKTPTDAKGRAIYDGLLEVLEPARRVARQQREMAEAAKAAGVDAAYATVPGGTHLAAYLTYAAHIFDFLDRSKP